MESDPPERSGRTSFTPVVVGTVWRRCTQAVAPPPRPPLPPLPYVAPTTTCLDSWHPSLLKSLGAAFVASFAAATCRDSLAEPCVELWRADAVPLISGHPSSFAPQHVSPQLLSLIPDSLEQ